MGLFSSKCTSKARLDGKTAIVTGANTGIGKCTAQDFYSRGAHVIVACRNSNKAEQAVEDIKKACKDLKNLGTIVTTELDLSNLKSVRDCAARLLNVENRIDILVNNAGVMMYSEDRTEDGFEMHMGTNYLGHFLFTLLLLPKICHSAPARIVNVSSMLHSGDRIDLNDLNFQQKKYVSSKCYQQSKLANILFTRELARRLEEKGVSGVTCYSLHPGVIKKEISRHMEKGSTIISLFYSLLGWTLKTPEQGAQTQIYCSVDDKCANETGLYYAECAPKKPSKWALDGDDARNLWYLSWKMVGLKENYDPFTQSFGV